MDLVGILVGDLDAELLFFLSRAPVSEAILPRVVVREQHLRSYLLNGHDNLDGIERVESQVVGKVRRLGDLGGVRDLW